MGPAPARAGLGGHHGEVLLVAAAAAGDRAVPGGPHADPAVDAGVGQPRRAAAGGPPGHDVLPREPVHAPARRPGRSLGHAVVVRAAVGHEGHVRPAPSKRYERACHAALWLHSESVDQSCVPGASRGRHDRRASAGLVPDAQIRNRRNHPELPAMTDLGCRV